MCQFVNKDGCPCSYCCDIFHFSSATTWQVANTKCPLQMLCFWGQSSSLAKRSWYVPPTNSWLMPTRFIRFNCALNQIQNRRSERSNQWNDSIYWCLGECFLGNPHCWPSNRSQEILFNFKTTWKVFIYHKANLIHIKDFFLCKLNQL